MRRHRFIHTLRSLGFKGAIVVASILFMSNSVTHAQTSPEDDKKDAKTTSKPAEVAQAPATKDAPPVESASTKGAPPADGEVAAAEQAAPAQESPELERCMISKPERSQVTARLKKMRPKPAAKMLAAMSPDLAADLLLRMDTRQSARILNEMPPRTGATLLTILSSASSPSKATTVPTAP